MHTVRDDCNKMTISAEKQHLYEYFLFIEANIIEAECPCLHPTNTMTCGGVKESNFTIPRNVVHKLVKDDRNKATSKKDATLTKKAKKSVVNQLGPVTK